MLRRLSGASAAAASSLLPREGTARRGFAGTPARLALELRPNCECCDRDLVASKEHDAFICSFECTFCRSCAEEHSMCCPNCSEGLVPRPARSDAKLVSSPGSSRRVRRLLDGMEDPQPSI